MASTVIYIVCLKTSFRSITVHRIVYTYSSEISLSSGVGLIHGTCLGSLLRVIHIIVQLFMFLPNVCKQCALNNTTCDLVVMHEALDIFL